MALQMEKIRSEEGDAKSSIALYKIISYPADYTLEVLYSKWQQGEIIIPDFQRGFIWTHSQASRLIESFLMGLPVPPIFLYKEVSERHLLVDGHQRLRSVVSFFEGTLPDGRVFRLKDVNASWNDLRYADLKETDMRLIRNSVLRAMILQQVVPNDMTSVYHVFERLNTGGTSATPQEVRNCVYHGPFNDFIIELNKDAEWRAILGASSPDKRMRDIELLVRFFSLAEDYKGYSRPMKDFLSKFMKRYQDSSDNRMFKDRFAQTVGQVLQTLGKRPFHRRVGLNAAIFDSVMVAFATSGTQQPSDIQSRYQKLLSMTEYVDCTTQHTTDADKVIERIDLAKKVLFD